MISIAKSTGSSSPSPERTNLEPLGYGSVLEQIGNLLTMIQIHLMSSTRNCLHRHLEETRISIAKSSGSLSPSPDRTFLDSKWNWIFNLLKISNSLIMIQFIDKSVEVRGFAKPHCTTSDLSRRGYGVLLL